MGKIISKQINSDGNTAYIAGTKKENGVLSILTVEDIPKKRIRFCEK